MRKIEAYSWQAEVEELQSSISLLRDIVECKRYRGEDVSAYLDDIEELKRDIEEIKKRNSVSLF